MSELREVYAELLARQPENQIEVRLDATRRAVELLGNVHTAAPVIHIAGTNGKSSTARMIDSLLTAHDLRVGRFTSPHLSSVTERISVDSEPVSEQDFVRIYREIEPYLQMVDAELAREGRARLTFFEALTVLAFAIFADAPVDVVVLEAGLGGEWDATNVADGQVCVFTPIAVDHAALLGDTPAQIARTKAGILDRHTAEGPAPLVAVGEQPEEALAALAERIESAGLTAVYAGTGFGLLARERAVDGQLISVQTAAGRYEDLLLPVHGVHQAGNAALAIAAVELFLTGGDRALDREVVGNGLAAVTTPGRLEVVRRAPTVVLDAAHNPSGAAGLAAALGDAFHFSTTIGVLAVFRDKDVHGLLGSLVEAFDRVIVTRSLSPRALQPAELEELALQWWDDENVTAEPDMEAAIVRAVHEAQATGDEAGAGIVVTGSVSTVAEARALLKGDA